MSVGAPGIGQDMRIAPVILGAGHGEAVAEPVELFRIDRVGLEPAFEQRFDDRAVRHFDRDGDRGRLRCRHRQQPSAKIGKAGPAMGKGALADHLAVGIDQTNLVRLACPVDAGEPSGIVGHRSLLHSRAYRDACHSLYWRSWRDSPRDLHRGQPAEARVPPRCSKHRGQ